MKKVRLRPISGARWLDRKHQKMETSDMRPAVTNHPEQPAFLLESAELVDTAQVTAGLRDGLAMKPTQCAARDWSNVAFAVAFCEEARQKYEGKLAS
jgi:hypothetical protein